MNLNEYYILAQSFLEVANQNSLIANATSLRTTLNNIINAKNQNQPGQSPQLVGWRDKIEGQKNILLNSIINTRNDLFLKGALTNLADKFTNANMVDSLQSLNKSTDINSPQDLTYIISFLGDLQQLNVFYTTVKNYGENHADIIENAVNAYNKDYISLKFEYEAFFDDLQKLSTVSRDWGQIINVFARLAGTNNTKGEILALRRGSTIIDLIADPSVIKELIAFASAAMTLVNRVLKVKEQQVSIEKLKLENQRDIIKLLDKSASINTTAEAKRISDELTEKFYDELNNTNPKEATRNALNIAVKKALKYFKDGMKVDPKLLNQTAEDIKSIQQLHVLNDTVKEQQKFLENSENKIILLEEHIDEDIPFDETDSGAGAID